MTVETLTDDERAFLAPNVHRYRLTGDVTAKALRIIDAHAVDRAALVEQAERDHALAEEWRATAERYRLEAEELRTQAARARDNHERAAEALAATSALLARAWEQWGASVDGADDHSAQCLARDIESRLSSQPAAPERAFYDGSCLKCGSAPVGGDHLCHECRPAAPTDHERAVLGNPYDLSDPRHPARIARREAKR